MKEKQKRMKEEAEKRREKEKGGWKSIKPRRTRQRDGTCPKDPLIQSIHHHSSFFQFTAQLLLATLPTTSTTLLEAAAITLSPHLSLFV